MNIIEYYEYAKLAAAAYVNMDAYPTGFTDTQFAIEANKDQSPRVPLAVANQTFVYDSENNPNPWTIPTGGYYGNDSVGFAATLFQRGTEKILAIRGTEPDLLTREFSRDLLKADLQELGEYGMAISQAVSLFNYVQCLMAPTGQTDVIQLQFHSALIPPTPAQRSGDYVTAPGSPPQFLWVTKTYTGQGLGELINYGDNLTITGHSLGGHLAAIGARLFPSLFKEAITFNAPGYDPALGVSNVSDYAFVSRGKQLTDEFINTLFAPNLMDAPAPTFAGHVITLESEDAIPGDDSDGVSGNATGKPFSPEIYLTTEKVTHDIGHLMDGLGVQALMARMDSTLTTAQAGKILEAITATTGETYELLLEKLHKAIIGTPLTLPRTEPSWTKVDGGEIAPRREYYVAIVNLENIVKANPALHIESLIGKSASELAMLASNPDANATRYRYSLKELNPFAVLGADYGSHNTGGKLDLYNADTGEGELTDQYLADRAAFLTNIIAANLADTGSGKNLRVDVVNTDLIYFDDKASGITLQQNNVLTGNPASPRYVFGGDGNDTYFSGDEADHLYGGAGMDRIDGGQGADYLEGNAGSDILSGGEGRDTLLGGKDNDILEGGKDNDVMNGGLGDDTYKFTSGDGWDWIEDKDGLGHIEYDGIPLAGGQAVGDSGKVWQETVGGKTFTYILTDWTENGQTIPRLSVQGPDGGMWVKRWQAGQLGLTLPGAVVPPERTDLAGTDDNDNAQLKSNPQNPSLQSTAANQKVSGLAGADYLRITTAGSSGYGGLGNDFLIDGAGRQELRGEEGNDILIASAGNDQLDGGVGDDALQGGADNDQLDGGDGMDLLDGGQGSDIINGGAGDDFIFGGGNVTLAMRDYIDEQGKNDYDRLAEGTLPFLQRTGSGPLLPTLEGVLATNPEVRETGWGTVDGDGADVIDAGAGNDWVLAGDGGDSIEGGSGNDYLIGQAGGDVIDGGADDDTLYGDGVQGDLNIGGQATYTPPEFQGNDFLEGGAGNDFVSGDGGNDELYGGDGNDTLLGDSAHLAAQYHGNDYLNGGAGRDNLYGNGKDDELHGGAGDDILEGDSSDVAFAEHGNDTLFGDDGADILQGDGGSDILFGGTGNDQLFGDADDIPIANQGNDTLDGGEGDDYLRAYTGNDMLMGGAGKDELLAEAGDDVLDGGEGDDKLDGGEGNDTFTGGSGADALTGGAGDDNYLFTSGDSVMAADGTVDAIFEDSGNDTVRLEGVSAASLKVSAANGGSVLLVEYGAGDQLAIVDGVGGAVENFAIGGETLSTSELIGRYSETLASTVNANGHQTLQGGRRNDVLNALAGHSTFSGGQGDDILMGSGGNNTYLYSLGDGTDSLTDSSAKLDAEGLPQPNTLKFGAGIAATDIKLGISSSGALMLQMRQSTNDVIHIEGFNANDTAGAIDRFEFADGSALTYAQLIAYGSDLTGTTGDDVLTGTALLDRMAGGAGNDTYRLSDAADRISEAAEAGQDTVEASIDYQLGDNLENLVLTGSALNGTGNALDNRIIGNTWNNALAGGNGDDFIDGGSGNDTLIGGDGKDSYRLSRLSGDDVLIDSGINRIMLDGGIAFADLAATRQGNDLLLSIRGDRGSTRVQDYFTEGVAWEIVDAQGAPTDTGTLLATPPPPEGNQLDTLKRDFMTQARFGIEQNLENTGFSHLADGSWQKSSVQNSSVSISQTDDLVTIYDQYRNLSGALLWTSSHSYHEVFTTAPREEVYRTDTAVHIAQEQRAGSDSVIHSSTSDFTSSSQSLWAEVRWGGPQFGSQATHTFPGSPVPRTIGGQPGWLTTSTTNDSITTYYQGVFTGNLNGTPGSGQFPSAVRVLVGTNSYTYHLSEIDLTPGNHWVYGDQYSMVIGNTGKDEIYGVGFAYGGDGDDLISDTDFAYGGRGDDTYYVYQQSDVVGENANEGYDRVMAYHDAILSDNVEDLIMLGGTSGTGNALGNVLTGTSASNTLDGLAGNDHIDGRAGDDRIVGGVGDDTLYGGDDAIYWVSDGDASPLRASTADPIDAGSGNIVIDSRTEVHSMIVFIPTHPVLAPNADFIEGGSGNDAIDGGSDDDMLYGGDGNDVIYGGDNSLVDAGFNNLVVAGGDDYLDGGSGDDRLIGGVGDDTYGFDAGFGSDALRENDATVGNVDRILFGAGIASAQVATSRDSMDLLLSAGDGNQIRVEGWFIDDAHKVERVEFADGPAWTVADLRQKSNLAPVAGTAVSNQMAIEDAPFQFVVPTSAFVDDDAAIGDTLSYNMVQADGNALPSWLAFDAATGTLSGTPASGNVGNLSLKVIATDQTGADASQCLSLTVSAALGVTLTGTSGNDVLTGTRRNDILDGGAGRDRMVGAAGNDTYFVDNSGDVVVELPGEGVDAVVSSVSLTLAANVENLALSGIANLSGTGNALDNVMTGNAGNNALNGGAGADTMIGGAGNDTYTVDNVGDAVTELASEGTDRVIATISYTLGDNVENLTLTGTATINGTGNELNNAMVGNAGSNILSGLGGNDSLTGGDANDALLGGSGSDTLNGGLGADAMEGGIDNDTYYVDNAGDVVTEQANEGTDRIISTISYTLGDNVENLTLSGVDAINGTGNVLNNVIVGNAATNILSGLGGNDNLTGGMANDTLIGGEGNDSLAGSDGDDVLLGEDGTDTLNGGLGADAMEGGIDNDTYYVDNAGDVVTEQANEGADRIISTISYTLGDNVENLTLSGIDAINGLGNVLANSMTGNTATNLLNGGDGNDSINGAAGIDLLEGMAGNDTLTDTAGSGYFNGGDGTDRLTGGAASDFLIGGSGNDTLVTGDGFDVIAFNNGDGYDSVTAAAGSKTVSLGGGLAYSDLKLRKSGNDLVLDTGAGEGMAFKNWYATTPSKPVLTLQIMAEAMAGFAAGGADPLLDQKVEHFNFAGLAGAFDAARTATPTLTTWALSNALLTFQLAGSDSAALGGDLAYQYGKTGTLAGIGLTAAQEVIGDAGFGTQAQALRPLAGLQAGAVRLG